MNKIQDISNALKAKLDTLVGAGKPFASVYDYYTLKHDGYPYVMFECTGFDAEILDSCNNQRNYNFTLYILQEVDDDARQESKEILYKAMSTVIDAIDQDYTLGGVVNKAVVPIGGSIQGVTGEGGQALVATINIICQSITNIR